MIKADAGNFKVTDKVKEQGQFLLVTLVNGKAQANFQAFFLTVLNALKGFFIGPGNTAEMVMNFFAAVKGNTHIGQADFFEFFGFFTGNKGTVGGNNRSHAFGDSVFG